MTDLVLDSSVCIDWTTHLPIILHMAILGLDHTRCLIHEHCKKLLVNLLMLYATHADHFTVAKLAISYRNINEPSCLNVVPANTPRPLTGHLSLSLSLCMSVCLSVSVSVYLSVSLSLSLCVFFTISKLSHTANYKKMVNLTPQGAKPPERI